VLLAAGTGDAAIAFIEIGALIFALAMLSRLAGRFGFSAIPLYLLVGLGMGEGGLVQLDVSLEFFEIAAEIGVLLLLFALGLEYSESELRSGLRSGVAPGVVDMILNFTPGVLLGLLLGWEPLAAVLLGGVTWISSSGVVAKVLGDLGRLGFRETPAVLNLLVIEDLAMAVYLPVVAALIVGGSTSSLVLSVAVALVAVTVILLAALRYGGRLSDAVAGGTDEAFLLTVFGITLLVAGIAQQLQVSGAIGAFLVGLALSGNAELRANQLVAPLRDLFAATFFLFFAFQIDPADLLGVAVPALVLTAVTTLTKIATGWYAAERVGAAPRGRLRAGTALIARGEFSIVIAALGSSLLDGPELGALAAGYVLLTAIVGPVAAKYADRIPLPPRLVRQRVRTAPTVSA
jgi:CPA2 family monovalent cation:H+ antiporter-2